MANPTVASAGRNREVHCASVLYTWSSTAGGTYASDVVIPVNAQIISHSVQGGSVVPTTGTNLKIQVGGADLSATIALAKYDAIGETQLVASVDGTTANLNGAIGLVTTGTHDTGSTRITVCYIV